MSAILTTCCCDAEPVCCDCRLSSSYSVAASVGWTTDSLEATGSTTQTMTVAAGFSSLVVSEYSPACDTGKYPSGSTGSDFAVRRYEFPTTAAVTMAATSSGTCTSQSTSAEAGTWSSGTVGLGEGRGLSCWHEVNTTSPTVNYHFWTIVAGFTSTATCTVGATTWPLWAWRGFLYSQPQTACHAPTAATGWSANNPAAGTTAADSRLLGYMLTNNGTASYCNTTAIGRCSISSYGAASSGLFTTPTVSVT